MTTREVGRSSVDLHVFDELRAEVAALSAPRPHLRLSTPEEALDICNRLNALDDAPRPDATEALRVAMEALATIAIALSPPLVESGVSEARSVAATTYELLRAHVEPTPLETAVLTHTEKETP